MKSAATTPPSTTGERGLRSAAEPLAPADDDLFDPHRHGDEDAAAGVLDFAVNVRPGPPEFLADILRDRVADLAAYPSGADLAVATEAIAELHGRDRAEVLLLGGAAEGFELLAKLGARHAALIEPSFTEPARILREAGGARVTSVVLPPPWSLHAAAVPDDADLVVVGNPTNPTSVLHTRAEIEALRRPGRLVVIDEAFADLTVGGGAAEPESLAGTRAEDLIVIRSVTKTFALAGLRAGYLLAAPEVVARLSRGRRHWPLGSLSLAALTACAGPQGQAHVAAEAAQVRADRAYLVDRLAALGVSPAVDPQAPYVLLRLAGGTAVKAALRARGIGVRSCANFDGLGPDYLRVAVRRRESTDALIAAMQDVMTAVARSPHRDRPTDPARRVSPDESPTG
ncbi:MAG: Rv2231c family pyridoxal phosphate-dependent protein CobC [Gordonia sp. (in: high G+C Gram-positive bacteria)]|uniref:Rv2231c family pyridoxal phosphate-dependent protein CobC n=1 Tax=Gordonia TaxID=2053 RepID=UPI003266E60F